jgi:hypothetical protein
MNFLIVTLFMGCWACCEASPATNDADRVFVHMAIGDRGCCGTNVWWLSRTQAARLPKWHAADTKPPLSLNKALRSAKKWIDAKGGGVIEEVVLRPVDPSDSTPYGHLFYYRISFGVAPYGNHLTCIVLMDGTVLEPECHEYAELRRN